MCVVRRRGVGLRVRSNYSKRVCVDSRGQLHADLDVDSQHGNHRNDGLVESVIGNDVDSACARIFPAIECFDHAEHFGHLGPDDIDVLFAPNVQNRRNSPSHFSRLDDRERSQQPGHHRRRL